jgi:hypothetical protein
MALVVLLTNEEILELCDSEMDYHPYELTGRALVCPLQNHFCRPAPDDAL